MPQGNLPIFHPAYQLGHRLDMNIEVPLFHSLLPLCKTSPSGGELRLTPTSHFPKEIFAKLICPPANVTSFIALESSPLKIQTFMRFSSKILIYEIWDVLRHHFFSSMWGECDTGNQGVHLMKTCIQVLGYKMLILPEVHIHLFIHPVFIWAHFSFRQYTRSCRGDDAYSQEVQKR